MQKLKKSTERGGQELTAQMLTVPVGVNPSPNAVQLFLRLQSRRKRRRKGVTKGNNRARRRAEIIAPSCPL